VQLGLPQPLLKLYILIFTTTFKNSEDPQLSPEAQCSADIFHK